MFSNKKKCFTREDEIKYETARALEKCQKGDYGLMSPPMKAQDAVNALSDYILGEDWYVANPVCQEQVNTEIVVSIIERIPKKKIKKKKRKSNKLDLIFKTLIGLLFLITGLYSVISNNYSEILIVVLSVFSFGFWSNLE